MQGIEEHQNWYYIALNRLKSALKGVIAMYVYLHIMPIMQKVGICHPQNRKIKKITVKSIGTFNC